MSLVDELNCILALERAEVEATQGLLQVVRGTDPDLARGVQDIHDSARWACSGLYHTVLRLDGTPTLDVGSLPDRLQRELELPGKLKLLCRDEERLEREAKHLLSQDAPDEPTRELLREIASVHHRARDWCVRAVGEWEPDANT